MSNVDLQRIEDRIGREEFHKIIKEARSKCPSMFVLLLELDILPEGLIDRLYEEKGPEDEHIPSEEPRSD